MSDRDSFAYVVKIEGAKITLNLRDSHTGQQAAHREGISPVTELGTLFGVDGGSRLLVVRVRALHFAEPREAHREGVGTSALNVEPLRHLEGIVQGFLSRSKGELEFTEDSLISPSLGAKAYPLTPTELRTVLRTEIEDGTELVLGQEVRGGVHLKTSIQTLLPRHVAVLGATGQGKSSFTAAMLQQLLRLPRPRIVVFDINGEYEQALLPYVDEHERKVTKLGGIDPDLKIPYYALGRHGLSRLLLPSEKTQRPALNFALDNLPFVEWFEAEAGAGLVGENRAVLFDDCRQEGAAEAAAAITTLRRGEGEGASSWPPMRALACLVADSHSIRASSKGGYERYAFDYGNIAPLVTRILRRVEDSLFEAVVDIHGGNPTGSDVLDWEAEGAELVDRIFGGPDATWKLHLLNLRGVAHDLMPLVLGSLLELLAFELFRRGQEGTFPTMLVLEEAHHYLRQVVSESDESTSSLAYERLAKEGRKFGLSLWLSTQRPSEVSPTVLGQCGTCATFRLTAEQDLRAISAASEWVDRQELSRIAGLPRQHLLVFGSGVPLPVRIVARTAHPIPKSTDPDFSRWLIAPETGEQVAAEAEPAVEGIEDDIPF